MICVAEPLDVLAHELPEIADRLTVILPWGSLLRGLVEPDSAALGQLRALCAVGASLEIVFSYDAKRDASAQAPLGSLGIDADHVRRVLPAAYGCAGLRVTAVDEVEQRALRSYETTWAHRLAFGQPRQVWRIHALT